MHSSEVSSLSNSTEVSYLSSNTNLFDNSKISSSSLSSKKSSIFIQDADDNHLQLTNLSASTESTAILNYENMLSSEDIHVYSIICILLVLLLLFFLLLLLIILKCKTVCQQKYQVGKGNYFVNNYQTLSKYFRKRICTSFFLYKNQVNHQ